MSQMYDSNFMKKKVEIDNFLILVKPGIKIVIPRKLKSFKKPTFTDAIAISKTQRQVNKVFFLHIVRI